MNRYKTKNYKSAVQFYNTMEQDIPATNIIGNPVVLSLGAVATDTGMALDVKTYNVDVDAPGLYRISAILNVGGVTAGDISFAIAFDGQVLPESLNTITAVAGITEIVAIETVKVVNPNCFDNDHTITIVAYSDGTGVATIEKLSGNVIKLA